MRSRSRVTLALVTALAACSDRMADYPPVDYTEEVARICEDLCDKGATCADPPFVDYDECLDACTVPGGMHDDTACGAAFRAWFGCVGGTATCEEYLDSRNTHAENFTCKEENLAAAALKCGAQEGSD